ncbi:MAG: sulfite exporter TauE/SafE family protein, partial [Rhodospirillaceae bacterium]|nr:sulfite exporter TauE/SafE family protein [Rhodospirillaceae bacterium]
MAETSTFAALGLTPAAIAFCLAVVLAAGFMRGFTGFGFAMAAVPLLAQAVPPAEAVPFVIMLQLFVAIWDWRESRRHAHWQSLPWLIVGALLGAPLGAVALAAMSADWARLVIAIAVGAAVFL